MESVHHFHGWHWRHASRRMWYGLAAVGSAVVLASLALVTVPLPPSHLDGGEAPDSTFTSSTARPDIGRDARLLALREQALARAEDLLNQSETARSKLQVARCAWELACVLPRNRSEDYRNLLQRASELLADTRVIEIMNRDDRILKARVIIELAPPIDVLAFPTYHLG